MPNFSIILGNNLPQRMMVKDYVPYMRTFIIIFPFLRQSTRLFDSILAHLHSKPLGEQVNALSGYCMSKTASIR